MHSRTVSETNNTSIHRCVWTFSYETYRPCLLACCQATTTASIPLLCLQHPVYVTLSYKYCRSHFHHPANHTRLSVDTLCLSLVTYASVTSHMHSSVYQFPQCSIHKHHIIQGQFNIGGHDSMKGYLWSTDEWFRHALATNLTAVPKV